MPRTDYIPSGDAAFLAFIRILFAYVLQHFAAWNIPTPETVLIPLFTNFEATLAACQDPNRGKVDTQKKNEARRKLEKEVRAYNKAYLLYNPVVTDDDRTAMGLPIYNNVRHTVQAPKTAPQLFPDTSTRRMIKIYYKDEGSPRRGKPVGVKGIEIRWAKLKEPPKNISQLINSSFDTNPPLELLFSEQERGERLYMCGCWEIQREGEKGPMGNIVEAIIP